MKNTTSRCISRLAFYSAIIFLFLLDSVIPIKVNCAAIPNTGYFKPTETFITPHIPWLKPYYKSKVKALFIVPRTSMRDVVELVQRMDLDYNVFVTESPSLLAAKSDKILGADLTSRQSALDTDLKSDYDVIIIGNLDWNLLPSGYAQRIISKVKSGTGLVGIINNPDPQISSAIPGSLSAQERGDLTDMMASFPFQQASEKNGSLIFSVKPPETILANLASLGKLGNGKIGLFTFKSKRLGVLIPGPAGDIIGRDQTVVDYQMANLIRIVLWAANKIPDVSIIPSNPVLTIKHGDTGTQKADFAVDNPKNPITINTDFFIINSKGTTVFEKKGTANLASGMNSLSFDIPALPSDKYRLNVIIGQNGSLINYATGILMVSGSSSISSIIIDKPSFLVTEQLSGTVGITGSASGMKLRVSRLDNYGRITDQKLYPVNNQTSFTLNSTAANLTIVNSIQAELLSVDGNVVDLKTANYTINNLPLPKNNDIRVILWSRLPKEDRYYTPSVFKLWKDSGVDTIYSAYSEHVPLANMNGIPILTRFADEKTSNEFKGKVPERTSNDLVRQPCLTDPAYLSGLEKTLVDGANLWKDYSVSELSLGDECNFCDKNFDLCFSPTCIQDFKRFVSTQYGSISDLNKEYGTNYGTFNDVQPMPINQARQQNKISLWVDHRLHMDSLWANIFQRSEDTVQRVLPNAITGYEGSDTFATTWRADDYLKLVNSMKMNNIYYRPFQSAVWGCRFAKGNLLGLGWFGGYTSQLTLNHDYNTMMMPWKTIFEGANSLWIWQSYPATGSVSAPDFAFYPLFQDALNTIKELKGGLGKALITADRQTDAGIYYSPASIYTETFLGDDVDCNAGYQTAALLTRNLGFQPKVYGAQDTSDGLLLKDKPKFLIMPNIQSISSAEANHIRQYVKNGGFVIADVNPGVRDSHGKLLATGSLDDIFGVKLYGDKALSPANSTINIEGGFTPSNLLTGKSTELKGGKANGNAGNTPVVIVNTSGTGKAVLLNFAIDKIAETDMKSFSLMINKLLSDSGVYPAVRVNNAIPMGLQSNRFISGGIQYVCLMQDWAGDKTSDISVDRQVSKAGVQLPAKYNIYNIRGASYLGFSDNTNIDIKSLDPVILALVPYKISGVKLNLNTAELKQGDQLQYTVNIAADGGAQPDQQVVRVRLTDPSGKDVPYYGANLLVKGSSVNKLDLALNEMSGKWTITATDIISGISANATFNVSDR
ncbi:MAG: beta-galactosidase trimerization domain-containing protein [Armatimonadota bacterium]